MMWYLWDAGELLDVYADEGVAESDAEWLRQGVDERFQNQIYVKPVLVRTFKRYPHPKPKPTP